MNTERSILPLRCYGCCGLARSVERVTDHRGGCRCQMSRTWSDFGVPEGSTRDRILSASETERWQYGQ